MSNIIAFPPSRIVRIPPARQVDVRVAFARLVEQRLFELTEQVTEGRLPGRFAEQAQRFEAIGDTD